MLLVGFFAGYITAKFRSILAWLRQNIGKKESSPAQKDAGAGQDQGEQDEDEKKEENVEDILTSFLSQDAVPGLDDHPEVHVNAIMLYEVKRVQEEKRMRLLIESLLLEKEAAGGFEPGYLNSLSAEERLALGRSMMGQGATVSTGSVGRVEGFTRTHGASQNSMAILVNSGLTLSVAQSGDEASEANKIAAELREKMKTIDKHLSTERDVDVTHTGKGERKGVQVSGKLRIGNALQMAQSTKYKPHAEVQTALRFEEVQEFAQRGRSRVAPPLDQSGPNLNQRLVAGTLRRQSTRQAGDTKQGDSFKARKQSALPNGRRQSVTQPLPPPKPPEVAFKSEAEAASYLTI